MTDVAHVLGEFISAWTDGERPQVAAYLDRVPPGDREDLADQIRAFMLIAPEPEYDEAAWQEVLSAPDVASTAARSMEAPPWPEILPALRDQRGLSLGDVAARLGVGPSHVPKAERMLEQMESGELDPERPSRRLLERLAEILGAPLALLDWRGGGWGPAVSAMAAPAPAAAPAFRTSGEPADHEHLDLLADALLTPAGEWDEVDELFLGGRE